MAFNYEYSGVLTARSTAQPAFQSYTWSLETIKTKTEEVGEASSLMAMATSRSFRMMIFGAQMAIFYTSMLISAQDRTRTATLSLEDAQQSYNEALASGDPDQVARAHRRLERAQLYVARANQLATLSYVGMGLQVLNFASSLARAIPMLGKYTAQLWAMATAQAAAKPWLVPAMVAGAGTVARLAAGYYMGTVNVGGTTVNVGGSEAELRRKLRRREDEIVNEVFRSGG